VNQQANGGTWKLLGTYSFDAGTATVRLTDNANGYVIADVVMLELQWAARITRQQVVAPPLDVAGTPFHNALQ